MMGVPAAAVGAPPVANPDTADVVTGRSVTVSPLGNDSDPEGDPLTLMAASVVTPGSGTAVVVGNDVAITTTPGFVGAMVVGYSVSDGASSASSQITVTVTAPPNSPPVAGPDSGSMYAPAELRIEPLANDSDPDGDALTISSVAVKTPAAGTATLDGTRITIRSQAGFSGTMVITYALNDSRGAQSLGTVSITVLGPVPNRAPVARADKASVRAGGTITVRVLANDSDPDGDRIQLVKVGKASLGTATRVGSTVRFRAPKTTGTARIRYTIRDARGRTGTGVLTVTVRKRSATPPSGGGATQVAVEAALARLRFPVGSADGQYDARTRRAVCAWRTVMGREAHRGLPSAAEAREIVAAGALPVATPTMVNGVTVSVTCQAAFWVGADRHYRRIMAASTGQAGYRTRVGTHRIFRTHHVWRYSTIYPDARMYKPMQFSGGQALHGSATDLLVKTYPASHGCVRMLHRDIDALQAGGVGNGTLVRVIGRW
jgi:hypothetical protein